MRHDVTAGPDVVRENLSLSHCRAVDAQDNTTGSQARAVYSALLPLDSSRFISASLSRFDAFSFELSGLYLSDVRMPSANIVKSIDVFEKRIGQLLTCLPGTSPNQLRLQCFEECF